MPVVRERSNGADPSEPRPSVSVLVRPSPKTTSLPVQDGAPDGFPRV